MRNIKTPTQYATYLLSKREYSPKDLERKLNKKFPEKQSENRTLIEKLIHDGYLSEERFSRAYGRYLQLTTTKGPQAIKQSLIQKGVSPSIAQQTIENELSHEETKETLMRLINKKWTEITRKHAEKSEYEQKSRLVAFLARKGYNTTEIYQAIDEHNQLHT